MKHEDCTCDPPRRWDRDCPICAPILVEHQQWHALLDRKLGETDSQP